MATKALGMASFSIFDKDVSEADLIAKVTALNKDDDVHGILVQFLCRLRSVNKRLSNYFSIKDVDGLNPVNAGRLASGLMP